MPRLIDLPNEVMHAVFGFVDVSDIENLAAYSPTMTTRAASILRVHHARQSRYSSISIDGCYHHNERINPLELLRDICKAPRLASYPTSLTIDCRMAAIERTISKEQAIMKEIMKEHSEQIFEMLVSSGCMRKKQADDLMNRAQDMVEPIDQRDTVNGLLLLVLPNLQSITISNYEWVGTSFESISNDIVRSCWFTFPSRPSTSGTLSRPAYSSSTKALRQPL